MLIYLNMNKLHSLVFLSFQNNAGRNRESSLDDDNLGTSRSNRMVHLRP